MPRRQDAPVRRRSSGGEARLLVAASAAGGSDEASTSSSAADDSATFGLWAGVAVTVNYIIGTGLLGIPAAFAKAGLLLGPALVLAGAVVMNASKDFILEAMARAEALHKASGIIALALRDAKGRLGGGAVPLIVPAEGDYVVATARKFEITDMFHLFVGPRAVPVYAVLLSMYMYGGLVSYTSVWSASWSANVALPFLNGGATCNIESDGSSGCHSLYTTWLLFFAALAVPLSCADLEEQLPLQVVMFAARLLVVALLTGTVLAGFGCDGVVFAELAPGGLPPTPLATLAGLPVIIPVAIFAFIFHHSVPGLSQPVKDKRSLRRVFAVSVLIVTVAYASIGLFIALAFGEGVASQCSLNWRQYVGCVARPANYTGYAAGPGGLGLAAAPACSSAATWADDGSCVDWHARPLYATIISFIVLIFPALDVLSAFPLNAVTLGNNLMSACLGDAALAPPTAAEEREYAASVAAGARGRSSSDDDAGADAADAATPLSATPRALAVSKPWFLRSRRGHRLTKVVFRLLAAVPPVIVAAFVTDLGNILQFTGLVGVGIAFTIPALLRVYSLARSRAVWAHVSRVLLPRIGAATAAEVDAAAPLPSVRAGGSDDTRNGAAADITPGEIDAAIAEGLALPVSLREALTPYPGIDAALRTPYTAAATRARGAQVMLAASLVVGAYVLVQTVIDVSKPK